MKHEQSSLLQLPAGLDENGHTVLEKLQVYVLDKQDHFEVKKSPLFIRNLARGDIIYIDKQAPGQYKLLQRSGNLAVRIFRKTDLNVLEMTLTPEIEKLDGKLEIKTDRALSYSLHVNLGFSAIEALFDNAMASFPDSVWYYGNVYDPRDGTTPLNWWDSFINQV